MAALQEAAKGASRAGLVRGLERAATAGRTGAVELLLGQIVEKYPLAAEDEAVRALNRAVHERQWSTASYLSDYLSDTAKRVRHGGALAPADIDMEVVNCLRKHVRPGEPLYFTDEIEDECLRAGVKFARAVEAAHGGEEAAHSSETYPQEIDFRRAGGAFNLVGGRLDELDENDEYVVPPGPLRVVITQPPGLADVYRIKTDGTRAGLASGIAEKYKRLYELNPQQDVDIRQISLCGVRRTRRGHVVDVEA